MKKLVVSLVFVLAMGNFNLNANTSQKEIETISFGECDNFANISQWAAMQLGLTFEETLGVWNAAYDLCIAYQMEHLEWVKEEEEIID